MATTPETKRYLKRELRNLANGSRRLVTPLGHSVERDRVVNVVVLTERGRLVGAVDRARGGIHQALDLVVSAALEDVYKTDQIRVDISVGVLERLADTRLCTRVHDTGKPLHLKQLRYPMTVCQV